MNLLTEINSGVINHQQGKHVQTSSPNHAIKLSRKKKPQMNQYLCFHH